MTEISGKSLRGMGKKTLARIEKAKEFGVDPLTFLLRVTNNPKIGLLARIDAAKAAAPYIHPKKAQTIKHQGSDGGPLKIQVEWKES